jgi:hypothetical protein
MTFVLSNLRLRFQVITLILPRTLLFGMTFLLPSQPSDAYIRGHLFDFLCHGRILYLLVCLCWLRCDDCVSSFLCTTVIFIGFARKSQFACPAAGSRGTPSEQRPDALCFRLTCLNLVRRVPRTVVLVHCTRYQVPGTGVPTVASYLVQYQTCCILLTVQ